jgi:hypothetical protein
MQITANGKNIDTHLIKNLLIQGEKLSETVTFTVDRFYNGNDLSLCSFFIRGVTDKNEEAQQGLITQISEEKITLIWKISEFFTATAGTLRLEIRAVLLSETDKSETLVLKYDMPPIFIKPSPVGSNTPMPSTTEQAINSIAAAVSDGLNEIHSLIDSFDTESFSKRLDEIDSALKELLSRPVIKPITENKYKTTEHEDNVLYIIVKE